MDDFITIGTVLVMGVAAFVGWLSMRDAKAWRRAADVLGISATGPKLSLDGDVDGSHVAARAVLDGGQRTTEIIVNPRPGLSAGLGFGPEGLIQTVIKTVAGGDVLTGDQRFDDAVLVHGEPPMVLAVLDAANRRLVRRLVADGAVLDGGELRQRTAAISGRAERIEQAIRTLVRAGKALHVEPAAVPERLRQRVARDPLSGVRRRALDLLLAHFPDAPETAAALEAAGRDRQPELRLLAAHHIEAAAAEVILAEIARAGGVAPALREEALDLSIRRLGHRKMCPLLVLLLDDDALAVGAALRLGQGGRTEALPALCARLHQGQLPARAAYVTAIGRLGDPRDPGLEGVLLPLLDEAPLRAAVAEALVRLGTHRAIEHLLPLTEGMLTASDIKQSARRALEAIRSRRGAGETGGLSLASTGEAGAMALVEDRSGRLAVRAADESLGRARSDSIEET